MPETFPSLTPRDSQFGLLTNTQSFINPLGGTVQTMELPGARWQLSMNFGPLNEADAAVMKAFLVKLMGASGRFYYGDPLYLKDGPRGVATGTPVVDGGSQTGSSLDISGFSNSVTNIVRAGDYLHFDNSAGGREMKMITADANSDGSGDATVSIYPPIRTSPSNAASVVITNAMAQMMLVDDGQAIWRQPGLLQEFSIKAVEAFTDA